MLVVAPCWCVSSSVDASCDKASSCKMPGLISSRVMGAGEEDNVEGEMAERATRLSESGGSRDIEDGGEEASDEAMRAMLGAQEYHEARAPPEAGI